MRSSSKKRWSIAANIILSICSFLAIMPFLLLIIASLTDDTVAMTDGYSYFPAKWSLSAYEYIANQAEMIGRAYFMTIIVTVIGTSIGVVITSMLAYMLAQKKLPGRKILNLMVD